MRNSRQVIGDVHALVAANALGAERLTAFATEYGLDDFAALATAIQSRAEAAVRDAIRQVPDGVYRATSDFTVSGHELVLPVTVTVSGDEIEVDYEGTEGWVNLRYVGYLGDTTDETSSVATTVSGAETMLDLGFLVAETFASEEEPVSEIVLVVAPTVGDLGEVTYDVIGLGDDAVRGLRVHVFGDPIVEAFTLRMVEVTTLCGRGVDAERRCV